MKKRKHWLLGHKQSLEHIEKRVGHRRGKKVSFEIAERLRNIGLFYRQFGKKNHEWKGNSVSYVGLHQWVRRCLGAPQQCEHCKITNAKKFEWANKNHKYKRNLKDWIRLCTSCHRKYDYLKNDS